MDLYHYTSQAAFIGILNSQYLRATHTRYLDDESECRRTVEIQREAGITEIPALVESLNQAMAAMNRYLVCFSTERDDWSQWVNYGQGGHGACLVFDAAAIRDRLPEWERFSCDYNENDQVDKTKALIERFKKADSDEDFQLIATEYWENTLLFKRAKFKSENEVRYLSICPPKPATSNNLNDEAEELQLQIQPLLTSISHPKGGFDEKCRPFVPFEFGNSLNEVILGHKCAATPRFLESLASSPELKISRSRFEV